MSTAAVQRQPPSVAAELFHQSHLPAQRPALPTPWQHIADLQLLPCAVWLAPQLALRGGATLVAIRTVSRRRQCLAASSRVWPRTRHEPGATVESRWTLQVTRGESVPLLAVPLAPMGTDCTPTTATAPCHAECPAHESCRRDEACHCCDGNDVGRLARPPPACSRRRDRCATPSACRGSTRNVPCPLASQAVPCRHNADPSPGS
mmetsp:Transcript_16445/g.48434  ORF Transcript_16445/g.48434 Transcript_16445/m.48434 type:complete len:205 (-) Transcript_16445:2-616(-)